MAERFDKSPADRSPAAPSLGASIPLNIWVFRISVLAAHQLRNIPWIQTAAVIGRHDVRPVDGVELYVTRTEGNLALKDLRFRGSKIQRSKIQGSKIQVRYV